MGEEEKKREAGREKRRPWSPLLRWTWDFLYPPHCLHCHGELSPERESLCEGCWEQLSFLDGAMRCPRCFTLLHEEAEEGEHLYCIRCEERDPVVWRSAAVFDYEGPVLSLVKALKYGGQGYLAKSLGGFLTWQFLRLGWPLPHAIVPVPITAMHRWRRGFNQSEEMAKGLGKALGVEVLPFLQAPWGGVSQAGLSRQQRQEQGLQIAPQGVLPKGGRLLLIDDVVTTGKTVRSCAEALLGEGEVTVYSLALAKAGG